MVQVIQFPVSHEQSHVRRFPVFSANYRDEEFKRHVRRVFSFLLEEIAYLLPNLRLYLVCEPDYAHDDYDQYFVEVEGVGAGRYVEEVRQIINRLLLELVDKRIFNSEFRVR